MFFNNVFQAREKQLPNKMQITLNKLNDDNVQQLIKLDQESTPDHHSPYSLTPILKDQEAKALMDGIRSLKNSNIRLFADFLTEHYLLAYNLGGDFTDRFKGDEGTLKTLKELIDEEIVNTSGIRMMAFRYLQNVINGCIKRCEGDRNAMRYS